MHIQSNLDYPNVLAQSQLVWIIEVGLLFWLLTHMLHLHTGRVRKHPEVLHYMLPHLFQILTSDGKRSNRRKRSGWRMKSGRRRRRRRRRRRSGWRRSRCHAYIIVRTIYWHIHVHVHVYTTCRYTSTVHVLYMHSSLVEGFDFPS